MTDRICGALKAAREKLCVAQTDVEWASHRHDLQDAINTIDQLGVWYCPQQWSKYDEPEVSDD